MAVWVRLPFLPFEYYQANILNRIGNLLGRTLKVDKTTEMANRGKFARLCVEMDISKPLISKFVIGGRMQRVEYEGIGTVCFNCGRIGHRDNMCEKLNKKEDTENTGNAERVNPVIVNEVRTQSESVEGNFGPWLLVQKKKSGVKNRNKEGSSTPGYVVKQNNFHVLNEVSEQEAEEMVSEVVIGQASGAGKNFVDSLSNKEVVEPMSMGRTPNKVFRDITNLEGPFHSGRGKKYTGKGKQGGEMKNPNGWQALSLNKMAVNFKRKRDKKSNEATVGTEVTKGHHGHLEGVELEKFKGDMNKITRDLKEISEKDLGSKKFHGMVANPKPLDIPSFSKLVDACFQCLLQLGKRRVLRLELLVKLGPSFSSVPLW